MNRTFLKVRPILHEPGVVYGEWEWQEIDPLVDPRLRVKEWLALKGDSIRAHEWWVIEHLEYVPLSALISMHSELQERVASYAAEIAKRKV